MSITEGIIIALIAVVSGILTQLFGLYRWRKEQPRQDKKTDAETQNIIGEGAEHLSQATATMVGELTKRVQALEDDKTERDDYIEALENEIKEVKQQIAILKLENNDLRSQNILKDNRISELETKTKQQEVEIAELRNQMNIGESK
jgi:predicted RNase H-like nuclease (RuvC/YqgF family)